MVDAESPKVASPLHQITIFDVETWFREAWPGLKVYPQQAANFRLAILVQGIADRANARSATRTSVDIYENRRKEHRQAHKCARALRRALFPVIQDLRSDREFVKLHTDNVNLVSPGLQKQIRIAESTYDALETFLSLDIPFEGTDHIDPILTMAELAKEAWQNLWDSGPDDEKNKIRFGPMPSGPLVAFIRNALECIGWAGPGMDCGLRPFFASPSALLLFQYEVSRQLRRRVPVPDFARRSQSSARGTVRWLGAHKPELSGEHRFEQTQGGRVRFRRGMHRGFLAEPLLPHGQLTSSHGFRFSIATNRPCRHAPSPLPFGERAVAGSTVRYAPLRRWRVVLLENRDVPLTEIA